MTPVVKVVRKVGEVLAGLAISAVLLTLSLPLGEQGYLAWIAFVPLLRAVRKTNFIVGFVAAILLMFGVAKLAESGIFYRHRIPAEDSSWLCSACGIFGFAVAMTFAFAADKKLADKPAWWFATIAVVCEALLLFQLPGNIGLTQYRNSLALMLASIGGIWVVSFAIWWVNLYLAALLIKGALWRAAIPVGLSLIGIVVQPGVGGPTLKVALLQFPNDDEALIRTNHAAAAQQGAELVVWPEFAGMIFAQNTVEQDLAGLSRLAPFVTSYREPHDPLPFNSAALFMNGSRSETYRKQKLFGAETKMHTPGDRNVSVAFGDGRLGLNICYDSCFPAIMRDSAQQAQFIALPTNDPDSPHAFMAAMHAASTPFRAAETGVPILRCDSLAFSHVVNAWGTIVAEAGPGQQLLIAEMPKGTHFTFAKIIPEWFLALVAGLLLFVGARRNAALK